MSGLDDLNQYLDATLADLEGYVRIGIGIGPYYDESGKYGYKRWNEVAYRWPADRRHVVARLAAAAEDCDAYACPYVGVTGERSKGNAVARALVHADLDHDRLDVADLERLGGWAVASGSAGHAHVYIPLAYAVTPAQHEALCRALCDRLDGDRAKVNDNDVLRPPGTLNHKPRAAGAGAPSPVTFLVRPRGIAVDPSTLAAQLGVDITRCESTPIAPAGVSPAAEAVDVGGYPAVVEALARNSGDRSADTARVVYACLDDGMTLPQTRAVVASRADLAGRIAERGNDDDVLRCWLKAVDRRQGERWADPRPETPPGDKPQTPTAAQLTRLADVEREHVSWLWPGYLPRGKVSTLDGDPGLGKSTLALTLAAPVTTGALWPDGTRCETTGAVLLLSAEDGLADTVRPRLDAAGVDVTKVHAVEGIPTGLDSDGRPLLRPPTLADVEALDAAIVSTGAVLLIVDVVMAYLPTGVDSHKDQDIRRVLARLSALADRTGCAVLLIRHLNKASGRDPLYRGGGSIGIVGAARAGLLVAKDPDDPDRRVLASVKSNLGPPPASMAYRLASVDDLGVARVEWEGATNHSARDLLADSGDHDDADARTEAEQWLEDYLTAAGGAPSKDVKRDAAKAGVAERTLQRARHKLGVVIESRGYPRVTWWLLPSRATPPSETPGTENRGTTGTTETDLPKRSGTTGPKLQLCQPVCDGTTETADVDDRAATAPPGAPVCDCGVGLELSASVARGQCEECFVSLGSELIGGER